MLENGSPGSQFSSIHLTILKRAGAPSFPASLACNSPEGLKDYDLIIFSKSVVNLPLELARGVVSAFAVRI
jgi:hypothetical protein